METEVSARGGPAVALCEEYSSAAPVNPLMEGKSEEKTACLLCPQHGVYIHSKAVKASAEPGASRRLVTHNNLVYDVTTFEHPGGNDLLEPYIGQDITEIFEQVGHSAHAEELLRSLCIGMLTDAKETQAVNSRKISECSCGKKTEENGAQGLNAAVRRRKSAVAAAKPEAEYVSSDEGTETSAETNDEVHESRKTIKQSDIQLENCHSLIDFSKALVPQIYHLNNADYKRVVDTPYCKSTVFRLLPWDCLEPMTKTKWWMVPLFWVPVVVHLSYTALHRVSLPMFGFAYAFGLFTWTLLEYFLHRFLFHFPEECLPDNGCVRVVHFLLHAVHHMLPMDPLRLVMPPALLLILSVPVLGIVLLILPEWFVYAAWPGGLTGYLLYDMIHYTTHHFAFLERIDHIRKMKRYHMKHHFKYPLLGFGVSSKFWDVAFGTTIPEY